ncbi:hypothetical protein GCK72_021464 [Caenorhabditis remanei]|uniref:F-box domain-containing protein n=1 Tax=Caenorhabditis remanei TaxID=31234 RepID=A0A6A5GKN7_CAERE|nr:hypothetical protein GCK72_021464 [Caenorhabditis remanei]KAF1754899.1 hypothetical protein GCK72_021464 [Caenorhabditis remanei]
MTSPTLLVDFPAVIKSKVLEKLDIFSILQLRKVCHGLREFIDKSQSKATDTVIDLNLKGSSIEIALTLQETKRIYLYNNENLCTMSWGYLDDFNSITFENECYIDVFLREFEAIMKHHWRPVLDSVSVEMYGNRDYSNLHNMLNKLKYLHSEKVSFEDCNPIQIREMFSFFDVKCLNKIVIEDCFKKTADEDLLPITSTEHWKSARCVVYRGKDFDLKIQDFLHFSDVEIKCNSTPIQDIASLKEEFLKSPTLTRFVIKNYYYPTERLSAVFGDPSTQSDNEWFFRIPNSEDVVHLTESLLDISFSRIKNKDVPVGAVIKY